MHAYAHKHAAVTVRAFEEWRRCREMLPLHFSHAKLSYHPVTDACLGVCCPNVGHFPRTHMRSSSGCRYFCLTGASTVRSGTSHVVSVADANLIASLSCSIIWPVGNNVLQRGVKPTTAAVELPDVWLCSKWDVHSQSQVKGVLMNELQVGIRVNSFNLACVLLKQYNTPYCMHSIWYTCIPLYISFKHDSTFLMIYCRRMRRGIITSFTSSALRPICRSSSLWSWVSLFHISIHPHVMNDKLQACGGALPLMSAVNTETDLLVRKTENPSFKSAEGSVKHDSA